MKIVVSASPLTEGSVPSRPLCHGSSVVVERPEIRATRFYKDFGSGFYCTELREQAVRWATRFNGKGWLSHFEYRSDLSLNAKLFETMTDEWLDFVVSCRSGRPHEYDIVEGPMADDTIYNYVQDFIDGKISRAAFWELARFKYPTHQISFHTSAALNTLTFVKGEEVVDG